MLCACRKCEKNSKNMKKMVLMLSLLVISLAISAIPAMPGIWKTLKLSDGTEVRAKLVGDEYGHWLQAADGTCYVKNNGVYERASLSALQAARMARVNAADGRRNIISASTSDGLGEKGKMSMGAVPSIGEYTIPVVMVQFSDLKFRTTTTVEKMTRYYNEEGYHDESGCVGSVRDYFKAQSGGQFIPTFEVIGIVTLDESYKYYGENSWSGNDKNLFQLPRDVINAAIEQLGTDFSKFVVPAADANHSEGVPLLAMFYAGYGEATGGGDDTLWPCEWDANTYYNGVRFNSFFIGNELYSGNNLMGLSVFCHEFGHAMGLPDFYVTDYSYERDDAFGHWSIMDTGAYVGNFCRTPIGYNAYEKSYMGWLELKEFGDLTEVTLQSPDGLAENSAYIVRHNSTETFIFENRQPGTWYPESFGSGVLVSRIAYNKTQWMYDILNNNQEYKRACVLTANGAKLYYSASPANLYGNSKNSIPSLRTWSGDTKAINITDVVKNDDGTITLSLKEVDEDELFYESFNYCEGVGGNDGNWSPTVVSAPLVADNNGWEAAAKYAGDRCALFGSSFTKGTVTSPDIKFDGEAVLTFNAAAYGKDGTALKLSAEGADIEFFPSEVTMKNNEWTTFAVDVKGSGTARIVFTPTKRFFLDEVSVGLGTTAVDGIRVEAVRANNGRIYSIDGRYVGTDLDQLNHGIYIVNGKKVVK